MKGGQQLRPPTTRQAKSEGIRIAYKFAKSNAELVGNWFTTDRIIVAVYRNARKDRFGCRAAHFKPTQHQFNTYADSEIIGTAGTRLLYWAGHNSNNAGNTPSDTPHQGSPLPSTAATLASIAALL